MPAITISAILCHDAWARSLGPGGTAQTPPLTATQCQHSYPRRRPGHTGHGTVRRHHKHVTGDGLTRDVRRALSADAPLGDNGARDPHRRSAAIVLRRKPFRSRLRAALASKTLPVALGRTLSTLTARRAAALQELDFEAMRARLAERRRAAVRSLPELIRRFSERATAAGASVYPPDCAVGAIATILTILQRHQVRSVVKSKSMATDEIGLNDALQAAGIEVVETDLGEFLVQAAGESPSHIIAPAMHMTRERAAEVISRATGEQLPADPERLVAAVRRHLREKFVQAGAGITGANALVAETGSVMLVSNEGNARLTSSLPPVHIVVAGIDKATDTLTDATAMLELLPRSASGQLASSYVSFITGPSRSADIEMTLTLGVHGPREVHIVLLDNGRSAMRADPDFHATLQCVRCGACSNVCPAYQQVGGHAMGHVYSGPIGLVLTPFHHGLANAAGPQSLCAGCNACATVCPAAIPLPALILGVRERAVAAGVARSRMKGLALCALASERWFALGLRTLARVPGLDAVSRILPGSPLRRRPLPRVAARPFRDRVPALAARTRGGRLRVAYFPGCLTDWLAPELGEAALTVLRHAGAEVVPVAFQSCCGLPAINAGYLAPASQMARQTIRGLEALEVDWIVSTSTSCLAAVQHDYPRLLRAEPAWAARAAAVAAKVIDLARFIDRHAPNRPGARDALEAVTIHDTCQSKHALGIGLEIRRLLQAVGYAVVEAPPSGECCGFGGSFSFDHPEVAQRMRRRKLAAFAETGAEVVCVDNPGCLLHLRCGPRVPGAPQPMHLAELLARSTGP